jgi:hypothetical protein
MKAKKYYLLSPLFLGGYFAIISIFPLISKAEPIVKWTPQTLSETVGQGQTRTEVVSLVSSKNLENVTALIVPELQSYLTVSPDTFSVSAGTPLTVTLKFSASSSDPLNTFNGTIHLRNNGSNSTIDQPLPITLTICRCVVTKGFSLNFPSSSEWQLDSHAIELCGPIALNNFGNVYIQGGIIPSGGAAIDITAIPLPSITLPEFITKELIDSTIESQTAISVAGSPATRVVFSDTYTPSLTYKTIVVYIPNQAQLYKFYISYRSGDSLEDEFITAFQQVLDSVKFAP